jgi:MFS transporter, DHA2 family, multidrug resistance protein
MIPIPFCFIAITNAAYVGLPKEASNQVSGIINFVRNLVAASSLPLPKRSSARESCLRQCGQSAHGLLRW